MSAITETNHRDRTKQKRRPIEEIQASFIGGGVPDKLPEIYHAITGQAPRSDARGVRTRTLLPRP